MRLLSCDTSANRVWTSALPDSGLLYELSRLQHGDAGRLNVDYLHWITAALGLSIVHTLLDRIMITTCI